MGNYGHFFFYVYLFILRERGRESRCERGRERGNPKQAPCFQGTAMNCEIVTWSETMSGMFNQLSHPGALWSFLYSGSAISSPLLNLNFKCILFKIQNSQPILSEELTHARHVLPPQNHITLWFPEFHDIPYFHARVINSFCVLIGVTVI